MTYQKAKNSTQICHAMKITFRANYISDGGLMDIAKMCSRSQRLKFSTDDVSNIINIGSEHLSEQLLMQVIISNKVVKLSLQIPNVRKIL
jgi:hypothetical protein